MNNQESFDHLKKVDLEQCDILLAIVKEYPLKHISKKPISALLGFVDDEPKHTPHCQYEVVYVSIDEEIEKKLRHFMSYHIDKTETAEEYRVDCPEPEGDQVWSIDANKTDFSTILEELLSLHPQLNAISGIDELVQAKAYMIVARTDKGINTIGYRRLPENWKMRKEKRLIPLLYKNNGFDSLDTDPIFSIADSIDFIFYNEKIFIYSKKSFEVGLKFREGMIQKAELFYDDAEKKGVFVNLEVLKTKVGGNVRYLRKISDVKDAGHYKDKTFLKKMKELSKEDNKNIEGFRFQGEKIFIIEKGIDNLLYVLQDKSLYSHITGRHFYADSVKPAKKDSR